VSFEEVTKKLRQANDAGPNTECPAWGVLGPKAPAKSNPDLTPLEAEDRRIADSDVGIH
jgi:hypothetical protein